MGIEPGEDQCHRLVKQAWVEVLVGVSAAFPIKLAEGRKVGGWPGRPGGQTPVGHAGHSRLIAHDPPAKAWVGRVLLPGKRGAADRLTGSGQKGRASSPSCRVGGGGFPLVDFYTGDTRMLRDCIARALPAWSPDLPGYHAVLGMHAFGLEETGLCTRAEAAGRRAVELEPRDAWGPIASGR